MISIDIQFQISGHRPIPADHGYALVGAVSRILPEAHGGNGYALAPITGCQIGERQMKLNANSRLVIRTSPDQIQQFLPLAGKTIDIHGRKLVLGIPSIHAIVPSEALRSRLVTIKGFFDPDSFEKAVRRQLDALGVGDCQIVVGRQRTLRIKRNEIVGFATTLHQLSGDDSLTVAAHGLGGRRHMGCGFFVPVRKKEGCND